jgi:trehalose 6-phosphate phosphatase
VAFDFDGTLAAIVPDPNAAVLDQDLVARLEKLRAEVGWLAVVSGRERAVLARMLPPGWIALGSYGLELPHDLSATGHPPGFDAATAQASLETARGRLGELSRRLPGTRVEVKAWGLALHYRGAEEVGGDRAVWREFRSLAFGAGLTAVEGRLVYEMKPKDAVDKGWALQFLREKLGPGAISFTGDDLGDVAAWDRLRLMSDELPALAVGIDSPEAPPMLRQVCDLVLADRSEVGELVDALLAAG